MPLVISNPKSNHLEGELWRLRQKRGLTLIPKSSKVRPCLSLFSFFLFSSNSPVFKSSTPKPALIPSLSVTQPVGAIGSRHHSRSPGSRTQHAF